eukprot:Hpha_TRINITY_DN15624_c4_g2::TRINITY_DN15624_c4_g2_i1::g.99221::m.99221/K19882/NOTUM; O-palmitoleoyl-L-serine hydrolase
MRSLGSVVALLGMVAGGQSKTVMNKWMGPAGAEGGLCMDGSPAGFYYAAAENASSTLWVISLEGGGACYDKASCDSRAKTNLGSSTKWAATVNGGGWLDSSPANNPNFYDSYKVYIPYCTSDTHMGMKDKPDASSFGYYFSGHSNVRNFMGMLLNDSSTGPSLKAATHVLVTGGSAGGAGTFGNVDYIQSRLPWAKVKGMPVAGYFFPGHTEDQPEYPVFPPSDWAHWSKNQTGSIFETNYISTLYNVYVPPNCAKIYPANETFFCGSVAASYPAIKAPIFMFENQFDTNQLHNQLGVPNNASVDPQVRAYIGYFGRSMRATITPAHLKAGDGAYLPSCFDHGSGIGSRGSTTIPGAPTQDELAGDWFWERGTIKNYFVADTCKSADDLPCNPTCNGVTPVDNKCKHELDLLECDAGTTQQCETCAEAHESQLAKAGCTRSEVKSLCESL